MSYLTQPSSEVAHSQEALRRVQRGFQNVPIYAQDWTPEQTLHVALPYENPCRWNIRRQLLNDARHHLENVPCVKVYVGEVAIGDEPFEVTGLHEGDTQYRCDSVLFHKENILNRIVEQFPSDWKYGAYYDADFTFNRHDWAIEAIHKLQLHPFVQLFSSYINLSANKPYGHRMLDSKPNMSFAATYIDNGHRLPTEYEPGGWGCDVVDIYSEGAFIKGVWVPVGATGGAWAFTREAYDTIGGFLDTCILGHADWFMAFGLVSQPTRGSIARSKFHPNYTNAVHAWQEKASKLNRNIGVVDNFAVHHYHGSKVKRAYGSRDQILVKSALDPTRDLRRNSYGIYELTNDKPELRDDIRRYMIDRMEDSW